MNLQLIRIEQDGSAKTFVYEDLDNPEKQPIRLEVTAIKKSLETITLAIAQLDFTPLIRLCSELCHICESLEDNNGNNTGKN